MKAITCTIEGNTVNATFDREELRCYLDSTKDKILWVEDANGNRGPIRVEFLKFSVPECGMPTA